jgi:hypothetical protein
VPATVARRLERLEAVHQAEERRRVAAAVAAIGRTMAPEHVGLVQAWLRDHCGGKLAPTRMPGESWYALFERLEPPSIVRALWLLLAHHAHQGTPISLEPSVAEVYRNDPEALPTNPCEGCGYLLPTRTRLRPDGTYRHVAWYMGECPVCGCDNHPVGAEDA